MRYSLVFGFWAVIFFVHMVVTGFCAVFVSRYLGNQFTPLIELITLILFYFYAARFYIKMAHLMHYHTCSWRTGAIWGGLTALSDFILLNLLFDMTEVQFLNMFRLWEGELYGFQILTLIGAPSAARWHRRKFRRDPVYGLLKRLNDSLSEFLMKRFYGIK